MNKLCLPGAYGNLTYSLPIYVGLTLPVRINSFDTIYKSLTTPIKFRIMEQIKRI